jgi:hypothetical protein
MEKVIVKEIREGKWKEKEEKWAKWATKLGFCSRLSSLEMCRKVCWSRIHCNLNSNSCNWGGWQLLAKVSGKFTCRSIEVWGMNLGYTIRIQQHVRL